MIICVCKSHFFKNSKETFLKIKTLKFLFKEIFIISIFLLMVFLSRFSAHRNLNFQGTSVTQFSACMVESCLFQFSFFFSFLYDFHPKISVSYYLRHFSTSDMSSSSANKSFDKFEVLEILSRNWLLFRLKDVNVIKDFKVSDN